MSQVTKKYILAISIRIKINAQADRDNMIIALASAGHSVWIEEKKVGVSSIHTEYYVCFVASKDEGKRESEAK